MIKLFTKIQKRGETETITIDEELISSFGDLNIKADIPANSISPNAIIGSNDLTLAPYNTFPYYSICQLTSYFQDDPNTYYGSAFMISSRVAVTAAHCVWKKGKSEAIQVTLAPGRYGYSSNPYGQVDVQYVLPYKGYMESQTPNNDWAILILKEKVNIPGHLGLAHYTDDSEIFALNWTVCRISCS